MMSTKTETRSTGDDVEAPSDSAEPNPGLPLDVIFGLLSNERRRRTLRYLLDDESGDPASMREIAEHVAGLENDKPPAQLTSAERKRVYISLYQCHLPKLDDADVVDFDSDRKTLTLAGNADVVANYLPRAVEGRSNGTGDSTAPTFDGVAKAVSSLFSLH